MKVKLKHYQILYSHNKLPRKIKKFFLGKRLSKNKLKRLLKSIKIGPPIKTMHERRKIYPFLFCPKCGCRNYSGTGNLTFYPEHWEEFYCLRCHNLIGYIDNSPFIHALECADKNYDPSF